MNLLLDAIDWILSPDRASGSNALATLLGTHLFYSLLAFVIACAVAVPLGYAIGHTGRGRGLAIGLSGAARALPSLGLILALVMIVGVLQIVPAVTIAFVLLAIPSILAGAYSGLEAVDRRTIDAARAMGMTEWQILTRVEIPLGLPLLIGGMRAGMLQIVATVTLAAYVGLGGLGYPIIQGIQLRRFDQVLGGALLVVVLALLLDALFAVLERAAVPRGVRAVQTGADSVAGKRPRAARVTADVQVGSGPS